MRIMLNEMEVKISSQISEFRSEFYDFQAETRTDFKELQKEVKCLISDLKEIACQVADAEKRINRVEERDGIVTEALYYLWQQQDQLMSG